MGKRDETRSTPAVTEDVLYVLTEDVAGVGTTGEFLLVEHDQSVATIMREIPRTRVTPDVLGSLRRVAKGGRHA